MDPKNLNSQVSPAPQVPPVEPLQPVQAMPHQPQQPAAKASALREPMRIDPKVVLAIVAVLALVLLGYWAYKQFVAPSSDATMEAGEFMPVKIGENTPVAGRLPAGFPAEIPVEIEGVTEAYARTYPERGVTQYTVVYKSASSLTEKFSEYESYMESAGYISAEDGSNMSSNFLSGTKDNDDLSVVLSIDGESTVVNLTYLDRE